MGRLGKREENGKREGKEQHKQTEGSRDEDRGLNGAPTKVAGKLPETMGRKSKPTRDAEKVEKPSKKRASRKI